MPFRKRHYNEIKKFMEQRLKYVPMFCEIKCPVEWAKTFLPLISDCVHREDYEAAKATADAIREFLNKFLSDENKIPETTQLNLPEYVETEIRGIICYGDPNDKSGLASGGAEFI